MVTDKTPAHKRASRAEKSATDWKMKAIERREENERLDLKIKDMENKIAKFEDITNNLNRQIKSLESNLEKERQISKKQQDEIAELKKKHFIRRFKTT